MRFITISALFLFASTTLAAPLDLSSREEDTYSSLALRDGVADTGAAIGIIARSNFDDENWLERRVVSAKKIANKAARKQRKAHAKAEVAKARKEGGNTAAQNKKNELRTAAQANHLRLKAAGVEHRKTTGLPDRKLKFTDPAGNGKPKRTYTGKDVRKANFASKAKHFQLKAAGVEHRKTTGLPDRKSTFTVPAGNGKPERTYTGKDVRKANFASHVTNNSGKRFGKNFGNAPHDDPGSSGTTRPIPGMVGVGHEHPLSGTTDHKQMKKDHKNEPARIISQTDAAGNHEHKGVIAHDQSRVAGQLGVNDHFLVHPHP